MKGKVSVCQGERLTQAGEVRQEVHFEKELNQAIQYLEAHGVNVTVSDLVEGPESPLTISDVAGDIISENGCIGITFPEGQAPEEASEMVVEWYVRDLGTVKVQFRSRSGEPQRCTMNLFNNLIPFTSRTPVDELRINKIISSELSFINASGITLTLGPGFIDFNDGRDCGLAENPYHLS